MRLAFLNKVYELTQGDENISIESHDVGQALGFDKKIQERVYFYLIDEGLILFRHRGGGISISYKGTVMAEGSVEPLKYVSPSRMLDSLVDLIEKINNISRIKLGCKLFNPSSKIIKDLRNIGNSEDSFVATILRIAMIIDQVYYREIQGQLRQKPPERSIDLMLALFNERDVDYDQTDLSPS